MVVLDDKRYKLVYLSLGTNLGDRRDNLQLAKKKLANHLGVVERASSIYETAAWGGAHLKPFLNQVVELKTKYEPDALLRACLEIEKEMGRERRESKHRYEDRLIDIDLLLYESRIIDEKELCIPHPEMHNRRFILVPLNELIPDRLHPIINKSMRDLLRICSDTGTVRRLAS